LIIRKYVQSHKFWQKTIRNICEMSRRRSSAAHEILFMETQRSASWPTAILLLHACSYSGRETHASLCS